jgi:hypothetical protein
MKKKWLISLVVGLILGDGVMFARGGGGGGHAGGGGHFGGHSGGHAHTFSGRSASGRSMGSRASLSHSRAGYGRRTGWRSGSRFGRARWNRYWWGGHWWGLGWWWWPWYWETDALALDLGLVALARDRRWDDIEDRLNARIDGLENELDAMRDEQARQPLEEKINKLQQYLEDARQYRKTPVTHSQDKGASVQE